MAMSAFGRGWWPDDPFGELRRMQAEMDRVLSRYDTPGTAEFPPINIWTNPEGAVVMARVPGLARDDVELTVHDDTLTIRGERRDDAAGDGEAVYHRRERPRGAFARTVVLPYAVDADSAEAMLSDGVLAVRLKRPEAEKPKRIDITKSR